MDARPRAPFRRGQAAREVFSAGVTRNPLKSNVCDKRVQANPNVGPLLAAGPSGDPAEGRGKSEFRRRGRARPAEDECGDFGRAPSASSGRFGLRRSPLPEPPCCFMTRPHDRLRSRRPRLALRHRAPRPQRRPERHRGGVRYGYGRQGLIPLWVGEGDQPPPAAASEALKASLDRGETFYTLQGGIPAFREAVAAYMTRVYGAAPGGGAFRPESFFATIGGMHAIELATRLTLGPGDEALVPSPAWPNFVGEIEISGARAVPSRSAARAAGASTRAGSRPP